MTRPTVLVVEDDPLMRRMLTFLLSDCDYDVATLADPRGVTAYLREHTVDIVLLDVMLPYIDGFALCATLRREYHNLPVIMLSARALTNDKLEGFTQGADDYVSKPFEPTELVARMQAVLRRYRRSERNAFGSLIKVGDTSLDLGELQFHAAEASPVVLTPTEMKILECLMRNANAVISRETLIERTWGYEYEGVSNRVDVYIRRLRRKIESDPDQPTFIHTIRGMGYVYRTA